LAVPASARPADAEERQGEESVDRETPLWAGQAAQPGRDAGALQAVEQAGRPSLLEDAWEDERRSSAGSKREDAKAQPEAGEQVAWMGRQERPLPAGELAETRPSEIRLFSE
jgi:hypothetical protein